MKDLQDTVSILIYSILRSRYRLDTDERSDFFLQIYPEIPLFFHRFSYRGRPFQHYLLSLLKWQIRSYIAEKRAQRRRRLFFERESLWNGLYWEDRAAVHENPPALSPGAESLFPMKEGRIQSPAQQRRILLLTMRGSMQIQYHLAKRISIVTGYEYSWISDCMQQLQERVRIRSGRLNGLRNKRNKYYVRIYHIHVELLFAADPDKRKQLIEELAVYKSRMNQMVKEIRRISQMPTHADIADVLGIPKGSVDSGLYYLSNWCSSQL